MPLKINIIAILVAVVIFHSWNLFGTLQFLRNLG